MEGIKTFFLRKVFKRKSNKNLTSNKLKKYKYTFFSNVAKLCLKSNTMINLQYLYGKVFSI